MRKVLSEKPRRAPQAVWEIVDDTAIIVHRKTGYSCTLDSVGADMWKLMDGKRTLLAIAKKLQESYDTGEAEIQRELVKFVKGLEEKQLVKV